MSKNEMSKVQYVISIGIYCAILRLGFNNSLFRCLGYLNYSESSAILLVLEVGVAFLIILLSFRNSRTYFNIFVIGVLPLGLYFSLAYAKTVPILIGTCGGLAIVCGGGYVMLAVIQYCRAGKKKCDVPKAFKACALRTLAIVCAFLVIAMGAEFASILISGGILTPSRSITASAQDGDSYTVENHLEELSYLEQEKFAHLSTEQKMDLLELCFTIECHNVGLVDDVPLCASPMEENTLAYFNPITGVVAVNIDYLENTDGYSLLDAIAHEAHHASAMEAVRVLETLTQEQQQLAPFENIRMYQSEFASYDSGDESFEAYSDQWLEIDARCYAELRVNYYKFALGIL